MTPIDWRDVFSNALWILGCAVALATLSYADWRADRDHAKLRGQFAKPKYRMSIEIALIFFCSGLAATSVSTISVIVWIILAVFAIAQLVSDATKLRQSSRRPS